MELQNFPHWVSRVHWRVITIILITLTDVELQGCDALTAKSITAYELMCIGAS